MNYHGEISAGNSKTYQQPSKRTKIIIGPDFIPSKFPFRYKNKEIWILSWRIVFQKTSKSNLHSLGQTKTYINKNPGIAFKKEYKQNHKKW